MNNFQLCHYLISSKLSLNRSFYIFRSKEKRRKKSDKLFKNQNCRIRLDFFLSPFHSLKPIVPHIFRSKETSSKPQNRLLRFHLFSTTISRALTFDLPHTSRTQDNETYIAPPSPLPHLIMRLIISLRLKETPTRQIRGLYRQSIRCNPHSCHDRKENAARERFRDVKIRS